MYAMAPTARRSRFLKLWPNHSSFLIATTLAVTFYILWLNPAHEPRFVPIYSYENQNLPPIYPMLGEREENLPQHNFNLPFPEGKHGVLVLLRRVLLPTHFASP